MYSHPHTAGWYAQMDLRLRNHWLAKMVGTTVGMAVFFVVYFQLLNHPVFPVRAMPVIALDRWIGFQPAATPLYLSLWLYVSLAPALLLDRRELTSYGVAAAGLSAAGLAIFFFWPTSVPRLDAYESHEFGMALLQSVDASGNACPSLHAAFAVFTAVWLHRLLRQMGVGPLVRAANWAWCGGILYSTLAVRQHVALDIAAGSILGLGAALAHLGWLASARRRAR